MNNFGLSGVTEAQRMGITECEFKRRLFSSSNSEPIFQLPPNYEQQPSGDPVPSTLGILLPESATGKGAQILPQAEVSI